MPFKYRDAAERLAANSVVDDSGCWIWTGALNNVGRPVITVRSGERVMKITVARFIVQFVHGRRWGRNEQRRKVGAHQCDQKLCANPDHVVGGTQKRNVRECVARGRHSPGKANQYGWYSWS